MGALPVSVVIVSRGRPGALSLCLTGVAQLDHPAYEVIVVACPEGVATVAARPDADRIKRVAFDAPNISEARNLGIAEAAGEVIAFLDDDAVPEPTWLAHLCAPFADPQVAAAGGYVRGRNGIDHQWRAQGVTARAQERDLPIEGTEPRILHGRPGVAVKLQGTNMAHRRSVLAEMGGFDPAFRFFLDETDLDMRHAAAGHAVAVVPLAEVHHGYAESPRRAADRSPRDLTEIGASLAVFLAKHCPEVERRMAWLALRDAQRHRLLRFLQRGPLGPDDVVRLMRSLDRGWTEGLARPFGNLPPIPEARLPFLAYPGRAGAPRRVLSGRVWNRAAMRRDAARYAADGEIVSAYRFSHTALFHTLRFHADGYWEQIGGLWGRSERVGPVIQLHSFEDRLRSEAARVAPVRDNKDRI